MLKHTFILYIYYIRADTVCVSKVKGDVPAFYIHIAPAFYIFTTCVLSRLV